MSIATVVGLTIKTIPSVMPSPTTLDSLRFLKPKDSKNRKTNHNCRCWCICIAYIIFLTTEKDMLLQIPVKLFFTFFCGNRFVISMRKKILNVKIISKVILKSTIKIVNLQSKSIIFVHNILHVMRLWKHLQDALVTLYFSSIINHVLV
jgi:hypothetical protein